MTPFSAIDAMSSDKSPMAWRGWSGFGSIWSMARSRPIGVPAGADSVAT